MHIMMYFAKVKDMHIAFWYINPLNVTYRRVINEVVATSHRRLNIHT